MKTWILKLARVASFAALAASASYIGAHIADTGLDAPTVALLTALSAAVATWANAEEKKENA